MTAYPFDPWATLAKLRGEDAPPPNPANPPNREAEKAGGLGALGGLGGGHPAECDFASSRTSRVGNSPKVIAALAAGLAQAAADAFAALQAPDLELDRERNGMGAAEPMEGSR